MLYLLLGSVGKCGHTFCYDCLVGVFEQFVKVCVEGRPDRLPHWLRVPPRPMTAQYIREVRKRLIMPSYRCPECRGWITAKPFKIPRFTWIAEVTGVGSCRDSESRDVEICTVFEGFFS